MIRRIVVTNFQKHAHKVVDLDAKITCLVGHTEAGKSAIIRALYWTCLNRPGGAAFVRHGQDSCSVKVYTKKHKVTRSRGPRLNTYALDGEVYKALGQGGVPPAVAAELNVTEDNFRLQLDSHFWFGDTAGQVSAKLNEVVNLTAIDAALEHIASVVRKAKAEVEFRQEEERAAQERLDQLEWVPEYLRQLSILDQLKTAADKSALRTSRIVSLVKSARSLSVRADRGKGAIVALTETVETGRRAAERRRDAQTIKGLVESARVLKELVRVDLSPFEELSNQRERADQSAETTRTIETLIRDARRLKEDLCRMATECSKLESELAATEQVCPTCGQKIRSSESSAGTFTCGTRRPSPGPRRRLDGTT